MTPRTLALLCFAVGGLGGCVSGGRVATSQPVDVEQLSGQIVAKIAPVIKAEVTANVQGIGYTSYFGIGVTVVMSLAIVWLGWIAKSGIDKAVCKYQPECGRKD